MKPAAAALACGIAGATFAPMKPQDEIRYRQSVMNVAGRPVIPMIPMAQDKIPYHAEVVARNTQALDTVIGLHRDSFGPGPERAEAADPAPVREPSPLLVPRTDGALKHDAAGVAG